MARVSTNDDDIAAIVNDILDKVKNGGDAAIRQIATEVEGFCPDSFLVSEEEIAAAVGCKPSSVRTLICRARERAKAIGLNSEKGDEKGNG